MRSSKPLARVLSCVRTKIKPKGTDTSSVSSNTKIDVKNIILYLKLIPRCRNSFSFCFRSDIILSPEIKARTSRLTVIASCTVTSICRDTKKSPAAAKINIAHNKISLI